jgi:hypothetical protein
MVEMPGNASSSPQVRAAMVAAVANLVAAHGSCRTWLFYSRDRNHYRGLDRYAPTHYRRHTTIAAVEGLANAGLIEHEPTAASPFAQYRSRFRATTRLATIIARLGVDAVHTEVRELLILRDADGHFAPYRDTAKTWGMRRDVRLQNKFMQRHTITLNHPAARVDDRGWVVVRDQRIDPTRTAAYRVFNRDFDHGGRWYGPWWQHLPADVRTGLLIDGKSTIELDFRACHLRLLAAAADVHLPDGDPYELSGFLRRDVKLAINVMINAPSSQSALGALVAEFRNELDNQAPAHAEKLMGAIREGFPRLRMFWNSAVGLNLQNVDADICARILRHLRWRGIPCLSVHDSFVVPEASRGILADTMARIFDEACQSLRYTARWTTLSY